MADDKPEVNETTRAIPATLASHVDGLTAMRPTELPPSLVVADSTELTRRAEHDFVEWLQASVDDDGTLTTTFAPSHGIAALTGEGQRAIAQELTVPDRREDINIRLLASLAGAYRDWKFWGSMLRMAGLDVSAQVAALRTLKAVATAYRRGDMKVLSDLEKVARPYLRRVSLDEEPTTAAGWDRLSDYLELSLAAYLNPERFWLETGGSHANEDIRVDEERERAAEREAREILSHLLTEDGAVDFLGELVREHRDLFRVAADESTVQRVARCIDKVLLDAKKKGERDAAHELSAAILRALGFEPNRVKSLAEHAKDRRRKSCGT